MRKHILRFLIVLMLTCFGACVFAACGGEPDVPTETTYTLTYTANGGTGSDITESHKAGDAVTIKGGDTFTRAGHTFVSWKDGETVVEPNSQYSMPARNVTLAAQWKAEGETPAKHTVSLVLEGDGNGNTATLDKTGEVEEGTDVTLTLTVASGYTAAVTVNGQPVTVTGNTLTIKVDGDKAVKVVFTQNAPTKYTVELEKHGEGNGNDASLDKSGEVEDGTSVKLTVTLASGYAVEVTLNGQPVTLAGDNTYTHTVHAAAKFVVTFTKTQPAIEGVWTGEISDEFVGGNGESQVGASFTVKKAGDAIDLVMVISMGDYTAGEALRLPMIEEGKYGLDSMITVQVSDSGLTVTQKPNGQVQTATLTERAELPSSAPNPTGEYRSADGSVEIRFGADPKLYLDSGEYVPELVPVGAYLVVYADVSTSPANVKVGAMAIAAGDSANVLLAVMNEETIELTKVEHFKNIYPTKAMEWYAPDYFYLYLSAEDIAWIQSNVHHVLVNSQTTPYAHGSGAGFLVDGTRLQIQVEIGAQNNPAQQYVLNWYSEAGELVAKTTVVPGQEPAQRYSVTVQGEHVTVRFVEEGPYEDGTEVSFYVTAEEGFIVKSVKNGADELEPNGNKYTVTVQGANIVVTVETQEKPLEPATFVFDANGGDGGDPALEEGTFTGKRYTVRLPENSYTAPANKYFRGWQIGEDVYFPGEQYDALSGATVTVKAVWEDLATEAEADVVVLEWFNAAHPKANLIAGKTVELVAKVADSAANADTEFWHGIIPDMNMDVNGTNYWLHLRVDGFIWTATDANSNTTDDLKTLVTSTTFNAATYAALYADGKTATHKITATLLNNRLTYTYAVYAEGDDTLANPVSSVTWEIESSTDISSLTIGFMYQGGTGMTVTDAHLKSAVSLSEQQSASVGAPIALTAVDYQQKLWTTNVKRGEKLTLQGSVTLTGGTLDGWDGPVLSLYKGFSALGVMRLDHYLLGNDVDTANPAFDVTAEGLHYVCEQTGALTQGKTYSLTLVVDYTAEGTILYTATLNENEYVSAWTVTPMDGKALADVYQVDVGGEDCTISLTSLQRVSAKSAPAVPFFNGGESDAVANPENWYWWMADGTGEWENGCAVTMRSAKYDPFNDVITLDYTTNGNKCWYGVQLFYKNGGLTQGNVYRLTFTLTFPGEEDDGTVHHVHVNGYDLTLHGGINHVEVVYTEPQNGSFSLQFGWDGKNDTMVDDTHAEISQWKWESASIVNEPLQNLTNFTVSEGVAHFTDPNEKGVAGYELAFYETEEPDSAILGRATLNADGSFTVPETLSNGTYYLRLRAMNAEYLGYKSPSGWTNPAVPFTVSGGPQKGELVGKPSDTPIISSGKSDAQAQDNTFMLWWVQGLGWDSGTVVTLTPALTEVYQDGKIAFSYTGGNMNYSVQLFYKNTNLSQHVKYYLVLDLKLSECDLLAVTVNGQSKTLHAGDNHIEVLFEHWYDYDESRQEWERAQGLYAVDIQFPGTEFANVSKVGVEISNVAWYEVGESESVGGGTQGGGQGGVTETKTLVPDHVNFYGNMYLEIFMSQEEYALLQTADRIDIGGYSSTEFSGKGFNCVGPVAGGLYQVNVRLAGTPISAGDFVMNWYKDDAVIATYTYTHTA